MSSVTSDTSIKLDKSIGLDSMLPVADTLGMDTSINTSVVMDKSGMIVDSDTEDMD